MTLEISAVQPQQAPQTKPLSSTWSNKGARYFVGCPKTNKERKLFNRAVRRNTRWNDGLLTVKERLEALRLEEEIALCFEADSESECESESDEKMFDGDDGYGSGDSEVSCNKESDGESSVDEEEKMEVDEKMDGNENNGDGDEEMEDVKERKTRKTVRWKEDDELVEIMIVDRVQIHMFGQERAALQKKAEEDTTGMKLSDRKVRAVDPKPEEAIFVGQKLGTWEKTEIKDSQL